MSIRMTFGIQRVWGEGAYHDPVTLYDDTDGMAFGPTFDNDKEADAFVAWFERAGWRTVGHSEADLSTMRHWTYEEQKVTADVWRQVWPTMAANPHHEHDPGCSYQAQCTDCSWRSNWGDSDNASSTGWDHARAGTKRHNVTSVHR